MENRMQDFCSAATIQTQHPCRNIVRLAPCSNNLSHFECKLLICTLKTGTHRDRFTWRVRLIGPPQHYINAKQLAWQRCKYILNEVIKLKSKNMTLNTAIYMRNELFMVLYNFNQGNEMSKAKIIMGWPTSKPHNELHMCVRGPVCVRLCLCMFVSD